MLSGCKLGDDSFRKERDEEHFRAWNEMIINVIIEDEGLNADGIILMYTVGEVKHMFEENGYVGADRLVPQSPTGKDYKIRKYGKGIEVYID